MLNYDSLPEYAFIIITHLNEYMIRGSYKKGINTQNEPPEQM
jgi:O-glycosyl hydrolase